MLTRGRPRSALQLDSMGEFVQHFLAALEDSRVVDRFRLIMQSSISESLDTVTGTLKATVADLQHTVSALQSTIKKRDDEILTLRREVNDLRAHNDDLEQHSRRASVRVFGVPENTPGSTDDMLLDLCNKALKLRPPLALEEIEVSHRVRKVVEERTQSEDGQTVVVAKPRPIIVKFVSRRTKARVMAARKNLKKTKSWAPTSDSAPASPEAAADTEDDDGSGQDTLTQLRRLFPKPVYISDDLTKNRAKLAFCARELKREKLIADTWVFDCSIFIKDNAGHIKKVTNQDDLRKYMPR